MTQPIAEPSAVPAPEPSSPVQGAPARKRNVALISGAMIADSAENGIVSGLFPVIQVALGVSTSALGILIAAGRLVSVVSGPLWVFLTRFFSRRVVLGFAAGIWGAWGVAAAFSQDFWQLLILNTIAAAGFTAAHIFLPAIVGDSFPDARRGQVIGWVYGGISLSTTVLNPLIAMLANVPEGWRWGYAGMGVLNMVVGALILLFLKDPGIGFMDGRSDGAARGNVRDDSVNLRNLKALFKIRTYVVLAVSRLISPHPVLGAFAVVLMVEAHGLSVPVAAAAFAPFGIGYMVGNILIGYAGDAANRFSADHGRIFMLQLAQFAFGGFAILATQFSYDNIAIYSVFFALTGAFQGWNAILNRPIVMAVVAPELRGTAFGFMISIVESISYSMLALLTGFLAASIGTQSAVLWSIIAVILLNGVFLTLMHLTYRGDRHALVSQIEAATGTTPTIEK